MALRKVKKSVKGHATVDGAGVHLVRVLGIRTVYDYDPFLMLDSFDSTDYRDWIEGFPTHPHRGIETITYLIEGQIEHRDSLGNKGLIRCGESQWMTAGSGIMHAEMPLKGPRMLGLQIWLNLPKSQKMAHPLYFDITQDKIPQVKTDFGEARVISGEYGGAKGVEPRHVKATLVDFLIEPGKTAAIPTKKGENSFVFLIVGKAEIGGKTYSEKSAVLFDMEGDGVEVTAPGDAPARLIYFQGKPLRESISWGGPIVMNSDDELRTAFEELNNGTFIKHNAKEAV
ncbi:MAG: pirin family protein [Deltaproteobacteria bacterium]|jgi:redox-sensitive bicupin YhaK (pirin superfamily)|nr:pirin family protein [Deltaproteobacteria bacterium]